MKDKWKKKKNLPTWQFHICWPPGPSWACILSPSGSPCWCKQTGNGQKGLRLSPQSSGCCCPPVEKTWNSASACPRAWDRNQEYSQHLNLTLPHRYMTPVSWSKNGKRTPLLVSSSCRVSGSAKFFCEQRFRHGVEQPDETAGKPLIHVCVWILHSSNALPVVSS